MSKNTGLISIMFHQHLTSNYGVTLKPAAVRSLVKKVNSGLKYYDNRTAVHSITVTEKEGGQPGEFKITLLNNEYKNVGHIEVELDNLILKKGE